MPVYIYQCDNCGVRFERYQNFTDPPLVRCPECSKKALRKIYTPVGVVFKGSGFYDQAQVEERQDVLVYTTARLAEPVAIAGPVSLTLYAASSAPDTHFTAKLVDVEADGYCANIAEGLVRARYRNGCDKEEFLKPGAVTEFHVDLWDMAHTFKPNHRIRLEISSSNFPRFDRNLNSRVTPALGRAEDARKAVQQIFHDSRYPSHLSLPVAS